MTKKLILLTVTGLSPQVVTETLYALYRQGGTMPSELHILSTAEGAKRAELTLFQENWLARFYQDFNLPMPAPSAIHIHVLTDSTGRPLLDVRSQADNQALADGITDRIRQLTADPDTALHVSIAGGRKTMGFYAGYALSLYGRDQDCLSHVLVSADYEAHPQFYYPTPYPHVIYGNDPTRKPLDTQQAEVLLAEIAFVRLRHGQNEALLNGTASFTQAVAQAQRALGPATLTINLAQGQVQAGDTLIKFSPADLAFYLWLLKRRQTGLEPPYCPSDGAPESAYAESYLQEYGLLNGPLKGADRTRQTLAHGMSKTFFEQRKSRINKLLHRTLGPAAAPYLIAATGNRPRTRFGVMLPMHLITFTQEIIR